MLRFTLKNEHFPIYVLRNPINVCWNPQNRACFSETIDFRGHMSRFTLKMNIFPSYVLRNPINVCWNPQNRAHFSEMINLRGHMSRFALKMNMFSYLSSLQPHKCVLKLSERGSVFLRWLIWGVTYLGFLEKWTCFLIYLLRNPINVCWNPQNRACFSEVINLRGHMPIGLLWKINVFPSISLETP